MTPEDPLQRSTIETVGGPSSGLDVVRDEDKIQLAIAYIGGIFTLGLLALIPMLTVKDSEFVRWHGKNALMLNLVGGLVVMVASVLTCGLLSPLGLVVMVASVLGFVKALKGQRWRIPLVSDLADKI